MIRPSTIQAGTTVLKSYEDNGIQRHSRPIEDYYPLIYRGNLSANQKVFFNIPVHLQVLSILISSTAVISAESYIQITLRDTVDNATYVFTINAPVSIPAGVVGMFIDFPFLVLSPSWKLEISINFAITYLSFWGKEVYVNEPIYGQKNDAV
jgi:hypothetical protein